MVYDYVKKHSAVKTAPAMAAGVASFQWTNEDIVMMAASVTFEELK